MLCIFSHLLHLVVHLTHYSSNFILHTNYIIRENAENHNQKRSRKSCPAQSRLYKSTLAKINKYYFLIFPYNSLETLLMPYQYQPYIAQSQSE